MTNLSIKAIFLTTIQYLFFNIGQKKPAETEETVSIFSNVSDVVIIVVVGVCEHTPLGVDHGAAAANQAKAAEQSAKCSFICLTVVGAGRRETEITNDHNPVRV
jgi:hypothetical protein